MAGERRCVGIVIDDLKCFSALGECFRMLMLYSDESYNNSTLCMGGWLAYDYVWKMIEHDWGEDFLRK